MEAATCPSTVTHAASELKGNTSTRFPSFGRPPVLQAESRCQGTHTPFVSSKATPAHECTVRCSVGEALGKAVGEIDGSAVTWDEGLAEGTRVGNREGDVGCGVTEGAVDG